MKEKLTIPIIFFGTPEFSRPALEALWKENYEVVAVVTNPDEPVGRKQILTPPPIKVLAQKHRIPVFQPERLRVETFQQDLPPADLYVVAAYGKLIPKAMLDIPKLGVLNIHPSLLPRWRGPAPIQYAILEGDTQTGVTIMKMDGGMDHGPIVANSKFEIRNSKITYRELHDRLAKLGAELLIEVIPEWVRGEIAPVPQDDARATYSKILTKEDGRIDWSRSAREIERMVRAFTPWPSAWTTWPSTERIYRVQIEEARVIPEESGVGSAGYVWRESNHPFLVKTGRASLAVQRLTLEGKKTMSAESFIRGYPVVGTTFI